VHETAVKRVSINKVQSILISDNIIIILTQRFENKQLVVALNTALCA